jgi:hypothetical protein
MDEGEEHELGGAWGVGAFENPRALKWVAALVGGGTPDNVRATLRSIVDGEPPSLETCMEAFAAAEIIAIALGRASGEVPVEARTWAKTHDDSWTATDVRLAVRAVKRIAADSELKDFWDEVDDTSEWNSEADDLASRLSRLVDSH